MKRIFHILFCGALVFSLIPLSFAATYQLSVIEGLPVIQWYKKLVHSAYVDLGDKVIFVALPSGRAVIEAQKQQFDGLTIRASDIEGSISNYIRVPVLLASGELSLYCQSNVPCNAEQLDDANNVIGLIAGVNMAAEMMSQRKASQYQVSDATNLGKMFDKERLTFILSFDGDDFGSSIALSKSDYQRVVLKRFDAYHYIHERHKHKLEALTDSLRQVRDNAGDIPEMYRH